MTQISRPFQIVLAAFALFVAVWFVALRAHNSSTAGGSGSGSSASSASAPASHPVPSGAAEAKVAAAPTHVYTGPVPGLQGLTRAIDKAHGAVAQSQSDVKGFEHAEPSSASAAPGAASAAAGKTASTATTVKRSVTRSGHTTVVHTTVVTHTHTSSTAKHAASTVKPVPSVAKPTSSAAKPAPAAAKHVATTPSMQLAVEHQLQQGKTVLILFWNPHGSDDVAVHRELPAVQRALGGKVAVHYASAGQVGAYGTITHAVQVTQTPTLLIVNPHGQTAILTGLADAFSIDQAVAEVRHS